MINLFEVYKNIYSRYKGGKEVDAIQIIELIKEDLKSLDTDFLLENIKVACDEGQHYLENSKYDEFQDCLFILKLASDEVFSRIQEYQNPEEVPNNVIYL